MPSMNGRQRLMGQWAVRLTQESPMWECRNCRGRELRLWQSKSKWERNDTAAGSSTRDWRSRWDHWGWNQGVRPCHRLRRTSLGWSVPISVRSQPPIRTANLCTGSLSGDGWAPANSVNAPWTCSLIFPARRPSRTHPLPPAAKAASLKWGTPSCSDVYQWSTSWPHHNKDPGTTAVGRHDHGIKTTTTPAADDYGCYRVTSKQRLRHVCAGDSSRPVHCGQIVVGRCKVQSGLVGSLIMHE